MDVRSNGLGRLRVALPSTDSFRDFMKGGGVLSERFEISLRKNSQQPLSLRKMSAEYTDLRNEKAF